MDVRRELMAAIESFDDWARPSTFHSSVSSLLDVAARGELERVWATSIDPAAWSTCNDLAHGCSLAHGRLASAYPWLSAKARDQLINGAAYAWW
jgi:hypothetical protein